LFYQYPPRDVLRFSYLRAPSNTNVKRVVKYSTSRPISTSHHDPTSITVKFSDTGIRLDGMGISKHKGPYSMAG
jgi:hypothetical protein